MCSGTHTHTHTHTCAHAHTHACMHARMHAHTHAHTHTLTHSHTHTHTHTHTHVHTHSHTHTHIHTHTLTHTHTHLIPSLPHQGYNGSIIAYGQTGTGKTFTIEGGASETRGVIPRVSEEIFNCILVCTSLGVTCLSHAYHMHMFT